MPGNTKGRPRIVDAVPPRYPDRTKACPACGREKPWSAFYPRARTDAGYVLKVRSKCKLCESGVAQAKWEERAAVDHSEVNAERRAYHAERMATDPEYAERVRKVNRDNARLRYQTDEEHRERLKAERREAGRTPRARELERRRRAKARQERAAETNRRLDGAPWTAWLRHLEHRFETTTDMADWLGVDESLLRRWLDGRAGLKLDTADAVLVRIGEPGLLMDLWPELYEEVA